MQEGIEVTPDVHTQVAQDDLVICLRKAITKSLTDSAVMLAYLHGSVAQGFTTPLSDVDVALVLDQDQANRLTGYDRLLLEMDMSIILQQLCQLPDVDVRVVNEAPLEFQGRIISEGILLYAADEDFRVAYETLTLKRFLDFQPVADAYREVYFTRRRAELASEAHHD